MLKHVLFVNQGSAENNAGVPNWALISITDYGQASIKPGWYCVHRAVFDDADQMHQDKDSKKLMTAAQAESICDFVHSVAPVVDGILVHCKGGVSRSAAVAKWIAMTFNLPFNEKYQIYNSHVFDRMIEAAAKRNRRPSP